MEHFSAEGDKPCISVISSISPIQKRCAAVWNIETEKKIEILILENYIIILDLMSATLEKSGQDQVYHSVISISFTTLHKPFRTEETNLCLISFEKHIRVYFKLGDIRAEPDPIGTLRISIILF